MTVLFGIDRLLGEEDLRAPLQGKRVALVAHPASVTRDLHHSLDALIAAGVNITSAFGPQHGLKGDKQDNMVETADELDPAYGIPIYSLYGEVRRPSAAMMASADVFLFDLQDLGCRIYTFVTTLSEGRGTTRPLEVLFGAPDLDAAKVLAEMERLAPQWLAGCALRPCWFEPTFHKHAHQLCSAVMIHAEGPFYDHRAFRRQRKAIRFAQTRPATGDQRHLSCNPSQQPTPTLDLFAIKALH